MGVEGKYEGGQKRSCRCPLPWGGPDNSQGWLMWAHCVECARLSCPRCKSTGLVAVLSRAGGGIRGSCSVAGGTLLV